MQIDTIPEVVFIIPYRDRFAQKTHLEIYMTHILEDIKYPYKIFFSHQQDKRDFNRGATKNIGFLAMKDKYPNDYKNMTFVFNDVDTTPYTKNILDYVTKRGIVKHFYGYAYALGGIFSINGADFELTGGFPNFWSWGQEDNLLYKRVLESKLKVDRSTFYTIGHPHILQFFDGMIRALSRKETADQRQYATNTLNSIKNLKYSIDGNMINVSNFETNYNHNTYNKSITHIRDVNVRKSNKMQMNFLKF